MSKYVPAIAISALLLGGCITTDNPVIQAGDGTADVTECAVLDGVMVGRDYVPEAAQVHGSDSRLHPDVFYLGWSQLDSRNDLRFPTRGYSGDGFEDKMFVSRKSSDGSYRTWQLLPQLTDTCQDDEKIRLHSFDVAPDGQSLFISMRREGDSHLGVYEFNFTDFTFRKITQDDSVHYLYPTYVGNSDTGNHMLFVAKTVDVSELPMNYGGPSSGVLLDEYDRAATPLIHILSAETGSVQRIGYNNSHQLEPISVTRPDGTKLVVFTQWEHQQTTNRFSLWKIQLDGSDNFTFFGQESATDRSGAHVFQPREIKTGPYAGYILMTQGRSGFIADGSIAMTFRDDLDLRSERIFLDRYANGTGISRNPEHYNGKSMVYAYRENLDNAYGIYVKDYPENLRGETDTGQKQVVMTHPDMHFVQPRSFYPPQEFVARLNEGDVGESRSSYTNYALEGKAGFLVQDLTESDNGVQHQLDGINPSDIRLQFFIPSHTVGGSNRSEAIGRLGWSGSPELSVPASGFIPAESDGSMGVLVKPGLYVWKVNKRFDLDDDPVGEADDIWIPIRAERQEISFVSNRVNACNQCHQERSQFNIDLYQDKTTIASTKMESSDLSGVADISGYQAYDSVPDFHQDIMPLLQGCAASGCHDSRDKLDLSNASGWRPENATWLALARGGHKLRDSEEVIPYIYNSINPTGFGNDYHPAPFLWALMLGDDLTVPPESGFPDNSSRALTRSGDYGATYDDRVERAIAEINSRFDHTNRGDPRNWSRDQLQAFVTYSTTQSMVGLSDRINFQPSSLTTSDTAAQKAYQAMVRQCFDCHNNHASGGVDDPLFGKPQEKRFRSDSDLKRSHLRFVVDSHKGEKADTAYSPYIWQSNINTSMGNTLRSALDRIDFDQRDASQLLVYARCDGLHPNVGHSHCLAPSDQDYLYLANWVRGGNADEVINLPPTIDGSVQPITFEEYAEPTYRGRVGWSDPDNNELSQLFINKPASSEHTFNDTMLALNYLSFEEAEVQTYAILGDRGSREFEFVVSDGQTNSQVQTVPVEVTSTYNVPAPSSQLPPFSAFYTRRDSGELVRINETGDEQVVGSIPGYSPEFTTVYRRPYQSAEGEKGVLYFVNQSEQRIYAVDEDTADVLFKIGLNHAPNKESDSHMQTVYLLWWRPAEYNAAGDMTQPGELQALLESRQGDSNGDFYVGLGDGGFTDGLTENAPVTPPSDGSEQVVIPEWRTRLIEADNAVSVYVWRRATFMTQIVSNGIDRLNVLNLVTGKAKNLGSFSFEAKNGYEAADYLNVRAVLLSKDGAFYGFNQDLNSDPVLFSFDPLERVQAVVPLTDHQWLVDLMSQPQAYGTPFVVVPPRTGS